MPTNQLSIDPQRNVVLRRQFQGDVRRRFASLRKEIVQLVAEEDAFGIRERRTGLELVVNDRWRFLTNDNKLRSYKEWLKTQVDAGILETVGDGKPWLAPYIESTYKRAQVRAVRDVAKADKQFREIYEGGTDAFLADAFDAAAEQQSIRLLYTRAYDQLDGVTKTMSSSMSRILADGLAHGRGSREIARELANQVGLDRKRALRVARTEMANAYAEGQLDALEQLGVEQVEANVEWLTAGDDRVCPQCSSLDGVVLPISAARGLIPRHPNCRCAWKPVSPFAKNRRQIRAQGTIRAALRRSISSERPNDTVAASVRRSTWPGADLLKKKTKLRRRR